MLLDEPVAGMSGAERQATGELLEELAVDHTVVVIEHDMAFLRRFARSVTVLHEGKILSEGSVDYVQGDPRVREVYLGRSRDERSGAVVVKLEIDRPRRRLRADAGRVRRVARGAVGFADVPDGAQRRRQDHPAQHRDGAAAGAVGVDPPRRRGDHQDDHLQAGPHGHRVRAPGPPGVPGPDRPGEPQRGPRAGARRRSRRGQRRGRHLPGAGDDDGPPGRAAVGRTGPAAGDRPGPRDPAPSC